MSGCVALAVYLAWGPLPILRMPQLVRDARTSVAHRARALRKSETPSPLPFLWTLHSEILSGSLVDAALLRACDMMPATSLEHTLVALQFNGDVAEALEIDSRKDHLRVLADVALIYRVCARTGAPVTESLLRIISSVRDEHRRQRTLAQEISSTKATVVVLTALPLLGVLMGVGLGLNPLSWLLHSWLAVTCLVIGVTLEILGWLWVRLLIRRVSRHS